MIYLYAFDYNPSDATLTDNSQNSASGAPSSAALRKVYLSTNFERPLQTSKVTAISSSFSAMWPGFNALPGAALTDGNGLDYIFQPAPVWHDGLRLDGESNSGELKVTVPQDHPVAQLMALDTPAGYVYLTVWALEQLGGTPVAVWFGHVLGATYQNPTAELKCQYIFEALKRPGLTRKHPRNCPFALFSKECGKKIFQRNGQQVKPAGGTYTYWEWREDGLLASVSPDGMTVNIPEAANRPAGFFNEGFIVIEPSYEIGSSGIPFRGHVLRQEAIDGTKDLPTDTDYITGGTRRSIQSHSGGTLLLQAPILKAIAAGARVSLYTGCDKAASTCSVKFQNFSRFGGYPYIPLRNPFENGVKN